MKLYNYLDRKLQEFKPIHEDKVGLYVCGPTVYGEAHLGHARSALTFDVLNRFLQYKGYQVRFVRNITDVGHLEDEEFETGEDKLEKSARLKRMEPMEVAQYYTIKYHDVLKDLNVLPPSIEPLASGHIIEQQQFIQKLLEKEWAYDVNGSVYFNVKKFTEIHDIYGQLSGKNVEHLLSGQREIKNQEEKLSSLDFALWKKVASNQVMQWPSPWGDRGVPGWHTECCVMSEKYLGHPFDIHGGGLDLQFPHHEAEIAQSVAVHGSAPANYWIYNNMVTIDNKKMSKSVGNFITLEEFFNGTHERLSKAYSPEVIRFFLLRSHYRNVLDVSDESLLGTTKGVAKLLTANNRAHSILVHHNVDTFNIAEIYGSASKELEYELVDCLDNDLDTPRAIALLYKNIANIQNIDIFSASKEECSYAQVFYHFISNVLGIDSVQSTVDDKTDFLHAVEVLTQGLLAIRKEAKAQKNFGLSDKIRNILAEIGIAIQDHSDGSNSWEFIAK